MDESFENLLTTGKYPLIWKAIAEKRVEDAKKEISKYSVIPNKSLLRILKKNKTVQNDISLQVASEILEFKLSETLSKITLSIEEETNQFAELIRLLFALQLNGHFNPDVTALSEKILDLLGVLAEQVRVQAGDYPNTPIKAYVWASGSNIREMCVPLADYFGQLNELNNKAYVLQIRTKITCSIMSHYPYTVGPDMIETALAMEAIGETDLAKEYYEAVIADFERIANEIKNHPEEEVWEEQIIPLTSLKQAYENSNRLNNTLQYTEQLQFVNAVIEKGVTRIPNNDEEDGD